MNILIVSSLRVVFFLFQAATWALSCVLTEWILSLKIFLFPVPFVCVCVSVCVCLCVCLCVCACARMRSVMSDSLQPLELQPTGLLCPWKFQGKNTRVGCHFLLQGTYKVLKNHWLSSIRNSRASLIAQLVTTIQFLGQEDPLEKG